MDEYDLRDLISKEFCKTIGGNAYSVEIRIPIVNKIARRMSEQYRYGWPSDINASVKEAVQEYV